MRTARSLLAYVVAQVAFLVLLRQLSPRFFYVDDQQAQYLPMFAWMGRHLSGGRPPLLAPEQGAAGNLVADAQYGVYDPVHWAISWAVARASDVEAAAWLLGSVPVLLLGLGIVALLQHYRCPPALAVAAALGVASTGFFLWMGSSWWPMAWSTAWLPWLWLGLASRSRPGVLLTGAAAYALASSGYPYNLGFAAITVAAQLGERWLAGGAPALRERGVLARLVAGLGGVVAALPGLLSSAQSLPAATRAFPDSATGNPADFLPNLADVLLGGSTLAPAVSGAWAGGLASAPLAAAAVFAVPAVALVAWRRVLTRPGVPTAAVLTLAAVLATQLPTYVGPFRQPWRFLADVGLYLPLLVSLGLTHGAVLTRWRVSGAAALAGLQVLLALVRSPAQAPWHLLALAVALAGLAALLGVLRPPAPRLRRVGAVSLVLAVLLAGVLSERVATARNARIEQLAGLPPSGEPVRDMAVRSPWPTTVAEFRDHSVPAPTAGLTAMTYGWLGGPTGGWGLGVVGGNANLHADLQPGFGYYAVGHRGWVERTCTDRQGAISRVAECARRLLEEVPGTGRPWLDLLANDLVLLSDGAPAPVRDWFERSWQPAGSRGAFSAFRRPDPTPGRVTAARGEVEVHASLGVPGRPAYGGQPLDEYLVSTGPGGGDLLLRIPAWPGMRATLGGRPLAVGDVEGTLTAIALPGGLDRAGLVLEFRPVGERLLVPALVLGGLLVLVAGAAGGRRVGDTGLEPVTSSVSGKRATRLRQSP